MLKSLILEFRVVALIPRSLAAFAWFPPVSANAILIVGFEPLHFVVEIDTANDIQRLESRCFIGKSLVSCQRFCFSQKCVSEIDDPLNAVAIGRSASFKCTVLSWHLAGNTAGSQTVAFHQSCLIHVH